jgi:hypothetical protein
MMMPMPVSSITGVDDNRLVEIIHSANQRLVVMAPGLSDTVAAAACEKWRELGSGAVKVILDVDAEVYRLGFGTLDAMKALEATAKELNTVVAHQPGVRIGLVITESTLLLFTPTPLLVEAGPRSSEVTNAVQLDFVPESVRKEIGLGSAGPLDQVVGLDAISAESVQEVEADLKANPPLKFDVARTVRVFNTQFEFVELQVTGYKLDRKTARIPAYLLGLDTNQRAQRLLSSSFRLIEGNDKLSGRRIQRLRDRIAKKYLISLTGYGPVVLRANKDEFQRAVDVLERYVNRFRERVMKTLEAELERNRQAVTDALLPGVIANPPARWRKYLGSSPDEKVLRQMLEGDLTDAYGNVGAIVEKMRVSLTFKGVTYESLTNPEFVHLVREKIPSLAVLHKEYDAARAVSVAGGS